MAPMLSIKYKPQEFLEKFSINIKAKNEEIIEKFRRILEKADNVVISNEFPEKLFNERYFTYDKELLHLLYEINRKGEEYLEFVSKYFYDLLIEHKLNKLIIELYEESIAIFNTIEKFEDTVSYSIVINESSYIDVFVYIKDNNELISVDSKVLGEVFLEKENELEFKIIVGLVQKKLKDYIKALLI